MAHSPEKSLRGVLVVFCVCLVGYFWLKENAKAQGSSCPQCLCDCSSDYFFPMPSGFPNISLTDCAEDVPELNEEMRKDLLTLTLEELDLRETVANESLEHTRALISEARTASSLNQKEGEKCNAGVQACEEARERAEAELLEERKLSALWAERALELGWKPNRRSFSWI